jgi:hypothetical protein
MEIVKNIIIFLVVFLIIMWLQHNDDKKFNKSKERVLLYDKIKIPMVAAIFVIIIKEVDLTNWNKFMDSIFDNKKDITNIKILDTKKALDDIFVGPPDF